MGRRCGLAWFLAGWATAVVTLFTGALIRHIVEATEDIRRNARTRPATSLTDKREASTGDTDPQAGEPAQSLPPE